MVLEYRRDLDDMNLWNHNIDEIRLDKNVYIHVSATDEGQTKYVLRSHIDYERNGAGILIVRGNLDTSILRSYGVTVLDGGEWSNYEILHIKSPPSSLSSLFHQDNGMFAYIYTIIGSDKVVAGRSRSFGPPLFWFHTQTRIYIAFDVSSILQIINYNVVPNRKYIRSFIDGKRPFASTTTAVIGLNRLRSRHELLVSDSIRFYQHSEPPVCSDYDGPASAPLSLPDKAHMVEENLRSSIMKLGTNEPIGIYLSGGIDSTSIASLVRSYNPNKTIYSYSAIFEDMEPQLAVHIDESEYIRDTVASLGLEARYITATNISPLDSIKHLVDLFHLPFEIRGHYYRRALFKLAQADNTKVLAGGEGGDAVMGYGFEYLGQLASSGDVKKLLHHCSEYQLNCRRVGWRADMGKLFVLHIAPGLCESISSGKMIYLHNAVRKYAHHFSLSSEMLFRSVFRQFIYDYIPVQGITGYSLVTLLRYFEKLSLSSKTVESLLRAYDWRRKSIDDPSRGQLDRELYSSLRAQEAMDEAQLMGLKYGVQLYSPYMDDDVVDAFMSLSLGERFADSYPRGFIRHLLGDRMPKKVRERVGKAQLGIHLREFIKARGVSNVLELVTNNNIFNIFDKEEIERTVVLACSSDAHAPSMKVYRLIALKHWFDLIDRHSGGLRD